MTLYRAVIMEFRCCRGRRSGRTREQPTVDRVDIDRDLPIAERFHVKSLPTILVVHRGQEIERLDGLITDEELKAVFDRTKARST